MYQLHAWNSGVTCRILSVCCLRPLSTLLSPLQTAWGRPFSPGFRMDSNESGLTGDQEVGEASDWGIYSPCLLSQGCSPHRHLEAAALRSQPFSNVPLPSLPPPHPLGLDPYHIVSFLVVYCPKVEMKMV